MSFNAGLTLRFHHNLRPVADISECRSNAYEELLDQEISI